jgi:hypothetical protein
MYEPLETTANLAPGVKAGTHGVQLAPGAIFIAGEGTFTTTAYRLLAAWEVQQLLFVFPHLFADMANEHRKSL